MRERLQRHLFFKGDASEGAGSAKVKLSLFSMAFEERKRGGELASSGEFLTSVCAKKKAKHSEKAPDSAFWRGASPAI